VESGKAASFYLQLMSLSTLNNFTLYTVFHFNESIFSYQIQILNMVPVVPDLTRFPGLNYSMDVFIPTFVPYPILYL